MTEASASRSPRVLQRVVFPGDDLDVVPLYVETKMDRGAAELEAEMAAEELTGRKVTGGTATGSAAVGEAQSSIRFGADVPAHLVEEAGPRRSALITDGCRVSFATYFNAFPASYWRRWTTVDAVTLRIRLAGESKVILYRSTARGHSHPIETINLESDDPETIERTLPLAPFIDGGWYWFDIVAGPRGTTLIEADWLAQVEPMPPGRFSIGITSFNKPDEVVQKLRSLGDATDVHHLLDTVYVVDQGNTRASNHPGFEDAAKKLAGQVQVIEQGNLGGSGGFSRSMDETVRAGKSDYVLLTDDDVEIDPEGILRAITFADLARKPTIVGGHMFSQYERSVLHAYAEAVAPYRWWRNAPNTKSRTRLWPPQPAQHPVAAPPGRWRLQRLVDVPDPGPADQGTRPRDPGVHQVGRRRVRGAGQGPRLPDRVAARCRLLAGAVDGQERRPGLERLLPPAQPAGGRAAALEGTARRPAGRGKPGAAAAGPAVDAVLHGGAARPGYRGCAARAGPPARRNRHQAGAAPRVPAAVR